MRGKRMAGVDYLLDRPDAVALLTLHHVAAREHQVVEDRIRIGPLAKEVVTLEERVVAVARMRDHQRLHRERIFLHEVRDAGIGVDDDLVGESLVALAIKRLVPDELLSVRPVRVGDRQPGRGIRIEHLLGRDDFDLIGVGVEPEFARARADRVVVAAEQIERPLRAA